MFKNYNKKGQKLPLFGIGPYMTLCQGGDYVWQVFPNPCDFRRIACNHAKG